MAEPGEAWEQARDWNGPVLVTGSFYMAGEIAPFLDQDLPEDPGNRVYPM